MQHTIEIELSALRHNLELDGHRFVPAALLHLRSEIFRPWPAIGLEYLSDIKRHQPLPSSARRPPPATDPAAPPSAPASPAPPPASSAGRYPPRCAPPGRGPTECP